MFSRDYCKKIVFKQLLKDYMMNMKDYVIRN
jgi:hypothetical protein